MSVSTGRSRRPSNAATASCTSSTSRIASAAPRPASAALSRNQPFGAAPMPTVNSRASPTSRRISPSNRVSSAMLPSVRNTTWRRRTGASRDGGSPPSTRPSTGPSTGPSTESSTGRLPLAPPERSGDASARTSAGAISVPPSARSPRTKRRAAATLRAVAARVPSNGVRTSSSKAIRSNVSSGRRPSSALCSAARAATIDVPAIEPDVSTTSTSSRGGAASGSLRAGGAMYSCT